MKHLVIVGMVCVLALGAVSWPAGADEPLSADSRIAALERRLELLEAQLAALLEKVDALMGGSPEATVTPLAWTKLRDRDHLAARLTAAAKEEKPVVVFIWGSWCTYCRAYKDLIEKDAVLRRGFEGIVRLEVDVTEENREDLREALQVAPRRQPIIVFFDAKGEQVAEARIMSWYKDESANSLRKSLELVSR